MIRARNSRQRRHNGRLRKSPLWLSGDPGIRRDPAVDRAKVHLAIELISALLPDLPGPPRVDIGRMAWRRDTDETTVWREPFSR